jgi:hypothetical protein
MKFLIRLGWQTFILVYCEMLISLIATDSMTVWKLLIRIAILALILVGIVILKSLRNKNETY